MKPTCSLCWDSLLLTVTLQLFSASRKAWAQFPHAKFQVLYSFKGAEDGLSPDAGLIGDSAGSLYSTTILGGDFSCQSALGPGCGVVFMLDQTGKETVLHSFHSESEGKISFAGLMRDAFGSVYGVTFYGGDESSCNGGLDNGCGTVFKVDSAGKESVLYRFTGGTDGAHPAAPLVRDRAGNLYGTALGCGLRCADAAGKIFKLDRRGKETVLHGFTGGKDGATPQGELIKDQGGNLCGTTYYGGGSGCDDGVGEGRDL
jgi:uncharacterized repeat protein (TIGR03803 family)